MQQRNDPVYPRRLTYGLSLVEPLAIGAHGVRRAAIQPGEYVLVMGAGPIGIGISPGEPMNT